MSALVLQQTCVIITLVAVAASRFDLAREWRRAGLGVPWLEILVGASLLAQAAIIASWRLR